MRYLLILCVAFWSAVAVAQEEGEEGGRAYPLDAMIRQVNGRAVYASTVLGNIDEQLRALGRDLPPRQFAQRARELIKGQLEQHVMDSLLLGEAMRDLSPGEQTGLQIMVQREREKLLRERGRGSLAVAEAAIREATGKSLEQTLEEFRQRVVLQRYLRQKLLPRINVTRRDIERYYTEHPEQFTPTATRDLRLIRVTTEADAFFVKQQLDDDRPFEELAGSEMNTFKRSAGGEMAAAQGNEPFGDAPLNEAVASFVERQRDPRPNRSRWRVVVCQAGRD